MPDATTILLLKMSCHVSRITGLEVPGWLASETPTKHTRSSSVVAESVTKLMIFCGLLELTNLDIRIRL
jgi:hypothetical protein